MMSNRRKLRPCDLSLILAAGLALGGCGSDSSTTTPAATPAPAASPAPAPAPSLPVPAGLRVSATGPDFIEWSWEAVEGAEGYVVELGLAADFGAPAQTATVATTTHRFTVAPETTTWARVRAVTGAGAGRVASEWSEGVAGTSAAADSDGDGVVDPLDAFPLDPTRTSAIDGISTTVDDQILVAVSAEDGYAPHPFDLNGRTLVFTPDGRGGYSRSVRPLTWEEDIGERIEEGTEITMEGFRFDFGGRSRDSFHVSRHGLLTFGAPLAYNIRRHRFAPMRKLGFKLEAAPTISPLFKPAFGGAWNPDPVARQHVAHRDDRIVVTWFASDKRRAADNRFQAVLHTDGSIAFNYQRITVGDGIVGLFDAAEVAKGHLLANLADPIDPELPGHLDLLDVALYATNTDSIVILEFTLREPIPEPGAGEFYTYRLHFDTDEPYWNHPVDWSDEDASWDIYVREGGEYTASGNGVRQFRAGRGEARVSLLADASVLEGDSRRISAMALAFAALANEDSLLQGDENLALLEFSVGGGERVDLSASDSRFSRDHVEIFYYRGTPNMVDMACRILNALGDSYDLFTFHSEFRIDNTEGGTGWRTHWPNATGIGRHLGWHSESPPCGSQRFRGHFNSPVWLPDIVVDDRDPGVTHEFIHTWAAYLSYERNGRREPLFNSGGHWRVGLHTPAVFPWRGDGGARSIMAELGGGFWRDNGDGTFTPTAEGRIYDSGPSWLDLYLIGLASASEVPDMFLLRNLTPVNEGDLYGPHTGDKEIITIEQIVAAEGPRIPSAAEAQKDFNAGFVYLLGPGQTPDPNLLRKHRDFGAKVLEHWFHVTGGRSRMTSTVPSGAR